MAVNVNRVIGLNQRSSFILTPANAGIHAFFLKSLNLRNRLTPNALGVMYDCALTDIPAIYSAHIADSAAHNANPDTTNVLTDVPVDANVLNTVMGEYAAAIDPGFAPWNFRQTERNEAWSDHINLIAWLYNFMESLNAVKAAFNLHKAVIGLTHGAELPVADITLADIGLPTPDGVVPSIGYNDTDVNGNRLSKYLAEIERSEPAFVKARLGTWIRDIAVMAQTIITAFNEHVIDATTVHTATSTTIAPIAQI